MPVIKMPTLMQYYTEKQAEFSVRGETAIQAVRVAAEKYPALKSQVFDSEGNLRRHINLFVNDVNVRDLDGPDTPVKATDVIRIIPAISGG